MYVTVKRRLLFIASTILLFHQDAGKLLLLDSHCLPIYRSLTFDGFNRNNLNRTVSVKLDRMMRALDVFVR